MEPSDKQGGEKHVHRSGIPGPEQRPIWRLGLARGRTQSRTANRGGPARAQVEPCGTSAMRDRSA